MGIFMLEKIADILPYLKKLHFKFPLLGGAKQSITPIKAHCM